jgi:hypothetical protein
MANRRTKVVFHGFRDFTVHIIFARDVERTGRRLGGDTSGSDAAYVYAAGGRAGWLILPLNPSESLVAHEAAHAVRHVMDSAGALIDDEVFAHHLDFLVHRIYTFHKR